jgi:hypothetical protein
MVNRHKTSNPHEQMLISFNTLAHLAKVLLTARAEENQWNCHGFYISLVELTVKIMQRSLNLVFNGTVQILESINQL